MLVPQGADQFDNARAGAALVLSPEQVSASAVRAAVLTAIPAASGVREAARRLAAEIAAMPSAEQVAAGLLAGNLHKVN